MGNESQAPPGRLVLSVTTVVLPLVPLNGPDIVKARLAVTSAEHFA